MATNLKRFKNFMSIYENKMFQEYQSLKQLMYEFNEYGKYKIYKENWFVYDDGGKVGNYYMFIDNNGILIIDKLNFDQDMDESQNEKIEHAKLFLEQLIAFCDEKKIVAAVSPDRIRDLKIRKKIRDFYKEHGFVQNKGKHLKPIVTETMYRPI